MFNYYKFERSSVGRAYFVVSLLTFLESSIVVPAMLIIAVYSRAEFDTKIWGFVVFLLFAIINYNYFVTPARLNATISMCETVNYASDRKLVLRFVYAFIFAFFVFSLVVEATEGYLYMVPVYLKEFIK